MAATCSAAQRSISSRRQQAQVYLCIALSLIALRHAHADTVTHEPGKIAVDPTSDEDASVELNQKTQLGASGTSSTTNAYPTYADGTKVTSANLNRISTPVVSSSGGGSASNQALTSGSAATSQSTPGAADTTSTASSTNSGTQQLIRSASAAPVLASTTSATGNSHATEGGSMGGVTGVSGGSAGGTPASLTGFLNGGAGAAASSSGSGLTAGGGGNSQKPASAASQPLTGHVTSVGGRKLKL